jgi:hypothetical protein
MSSKSNRGYFKQAVIDSPSPWGEGWDEGGLGTNSSQFRQRRFDQE